MHKATKLYGFKFQPRGNGMVIKNLNGNEAVKASSLGKEFAFSPLIGRLGTYELMGFAFDSFEDDALEMDDILQSNVAHYAEAHREIIRFDLQNVKNWQELHHQMNKYNLRFFERGNGLIIADTTNWQNSIKASDVDREFSKQKLVAAFGQYEKMNYNYQAEAKPHADKIRSLAADSPDWQSLHHDLKELGLQLRHQKNGLHIVDLKSKQAIKYSAVDPFLKYENLKTLIGDYEKPVQNAALYDKARLHYEYIEYILERSTDWQVLHHNLQPLGLQFRTSKFGLQLMDLKTRKKIDPSLLNAEFTEDNFKEKYDDFEPFIPNLQFYNYVEGEKPHITKSLLSADTWQDFHKDLIESNLRFAKRKHGYVITQIGEPIGLWATLSDKAFNEKEMEGKLGQYEAYIEDYKFYQDIKLEVPPIEDIDKHENDIVQDMHQLNDWQSFHRMMQERGIEVSERYSKLYFKELNGDQEVRAEYVDEGFSKEYLKPIYGDYQPYIKNQKLHQNIESLIEQADKFIAVKNWQDLHQCAKTYDLHIEERFNRLYAHPILPETEKRPDPSEIERIDLTYFDKRLTIDTLSKTLDRYEPLVEDKDFLKTIKTAIPALETEIDNLKGWQELHLLTKDKKFLLRDQKNGLHFVHMETGHMVKTSYFSDKLTSQQLKEKLVSYEPYVENQLFLKTAKEHRDVLVQMVQDNKSWHNLHADAYELGWQFRVQKNGLHLLDIKSGDTIPAKIIDPSFTNEKLEKRLGAYERSPFTRSQSYDKRPLHRSKGVSPLFKRYLGHKKQAGFAAAAFRSWKEFLMAGALGDPLAMAFLHLQNTMLRDFDKALTGKPKVQSHEQNQGMKI